MYFNQSLWQYNLLPLFLILIKPINSDNEVYFINIPNKLKRVTSLVSNKGLTNNNQFRVTSINYLLNIN